MKLADWYDAICVAVIAAAMLWCLRSCDERGETRVGGEVNLEVRIERAVSNQTVSLEDNR